MARGLVPKERFLEWGVEEGWGPLCEFLEKEIPETPFPNGNAPASYLKVVGGAHAKFLEDAYRTMTLLAFVQGQCWRCC